MVEVGHGEPALLRTFSRGATPPPSSSPCAATPPTMSSGSPRPWWTGRGRAVRGRMGWGRRVWGEGDTLQRWHSSAEVWPARDRRAREVRSGAAWPGWSWATSTRGANLLSGRTRQVMVKQDPERWKFECFFRTGVVIAVDNGHY